MKEPKAIRLDDWLEALEELRCRDQSNVAPPGWITAKTFARAKKMSPAHAGRKLLALVRAGLARSGKFRPSPGARLATHYHLQPRKR